MANKPRLSRSEAFYILNDCGIAKGTDFHALNSEPLRRLLVHAFRRSYKAPKNANGSTGRYFYAYVERAASRRDK